MNFQRSLLALSLGAALSLAGCATNGISPMSLPTDRPVKEDSARDAASAGWNTEAVLKEGAASIVLVTPMGLPDAVKGKKLTLELEPGATVTDVVAVLARLGHSVILADKAAGDKNFFVPRYEGTLGGFLSALSRVSDVWFTWHEGTIVVSSREKVSISIPQEASFAGAIERGLKTQGVETSAVSWEAGMATVELAPSQLAKTKTFLERMTKNAAVVTLQVAVVNVALEQTAKQGVDWEGLSLAVGRGASDYTPNLFNKPPATNTSTGTGGTGGTPNANPVADPSGGTVDPITGRRSPVVPLLSAATGLLATGGKLSGLVATGAFSFNAMFDFLQKYGLTETRQNAKLSTATGKEVKLKSVTEIPYVEEISSTANGGNSNSNGSVTGAAKTAKATDGLEVAMTPSFDAANNTVTIDFKLAIKAVIRFNELNAGNQLGTLTQPTTSEQSFSDVIRVRPGQTVVIGGLTYDSVADARGLPTFLSPGSKLESQDLKLSRQTMFVVIRPTVEVLGTVREQTDPEDFFPAAPPATVIAAAPAAAKEATPAVQAKHFGAAAKKKATQVAAAASAANDSTETAEYEALQLKD